MLKELKLLKMARERERDLSIDTSRMISLTRKTSPLPF